LVIIGATITLLSTDNSVFKLKVLFRRVRPTHHFHWCAERTLVLSPRSEFDGIVFIETG